MAVIVIGLFISRGIDKLKFIAKPLAFVGTNSIVMYLTHWPIITTVLRLQPVFNHYLLFALVVILEFPLIYVFNRFLPFAIGKKYKR